MTKDEILNMGAGEQIDILVAEKVMGWHIANKNGFKHWVDADGRFQHGVADGGYEDGEDFHVLHWHPSESMLWAWEVVEKFEVFRLTKTFGLGGVKWITKINDVEVFENTAELAICRAALLVMLDS